MTLLVVIVCDKTYIKNKLDKECCKGDMPVNVILIILTGTSTRLKNKNISLSSVNINSKIK